MSFKKFLIIIFIFITASLTVASYFYSQKQDKQKEAEQIKNLQAEINEVINLIDNVKSEMPKELRETHKYLMSETMRKD